MRENVEFSVPIPPTINHAVGSRGKGRFLTKAYKEFLWDVASEWSRVKPAGWNPLSRFGILIELHFETRRKCDIDNRVKPLLDALTRAGVWSDDSQVDEIVVTRETIDKERPRADVKLFVGSRYDR